MIKFSDILKSLSDINPLNPADEAVEALIEDMETFYSDNQRHKYHEIAEYIYNNPQDIEYIVYNLTELSLSKKHPELEPRIFKIIDHIKLEQIRLSRLEIETHKQAMISVSEMEISIGEHTSNIKNEVKKVMCLSEKLSLEVSSSKERFDTLEVDFEDYKKQTSSIENQFDDVKSKLNNFNMESITVLGIFSGIVMAFFGGMSFFNGVLNNIHQVSKYRIIFITLLIGFTLFNIFFLLIYSISKIVGKPIKAECKTLDCSCENKCGRIKTLVKIYPILFYIDLFSILMMVILTILWYLKSYVL